MRIDWLGRKGKITKLMEMMREVSKEDRPAAGKTLNETRGLIEKGITSLVEDAKQFELKTELESAPIDISLPVAQNSKGFALHPVTLMRERLLRVFKKLGFTIYDGPECDFDFYNFSALNIPDNHPARDMQDTFT